MVVRAFLRVEKKPTMIPGNWLMTDANVTTRANEIEGSCSPMELMSARINVKRKMKASTAMCTRLRSELGVAATLRAGVGELYGFEFTLVPDNGRFLRHRFSPKPKVIATQNSLPKRNHVAKEAVSAALQTRTRQRSERDLQTKRCSKNEAAA